MQILWAHLNDNYYLVIHSGSRNLGLVVATYYQNIAIKSCNDKKEELQTKIEKYKRQMQGIYSTTVNQSTLDESSMAYKPMDSIVNNIKDTVKIINIIKPIYNFKASC